MNRWIYHVLRTGVLLAVVFIAAGFILAAVNPFGLTRVPLSLAEIVRELSQLTPAGFLALGVILMVLTPVARVLLSVVAYLSERDRLYTVITLVVLANLLVGVVLGLG